MDERYYLVDADGYLVNVIIWDGLLAVDFGEGITAIRADGVDVPPSRPQENVGE